MNLPEEFGYQGYIREKILARHKTAVIAPPGAGKTRPIIDALNELGAYEGAVLIICSTPAYATWVRQTPLWLDQPDYANNIAVVAGKPAQRKKIWKQAATSRYGTYITNNSLFLRDFHLILQIDWSAVIADEYHKFMRRRSETWKRFCTLTRHKDIAVYTTGSLMRRDPTSMFTVFHLVDPNLPVFRSYWRFAETFSFVCTGQFGRTIEGVKNVDRLRKLMDQYLAYVPREAVAENLPEGLRSRQEVMMDAEQQRVYDDLEAEMMSILEEDVIVTPTVLSKLTKMRQLLCCPRAVSPELGMGAGFEAIVDTLDQEAHIVIFVPFRPACDAIAAELSQMGYTVGILRGQITQEEQQRVIAEFKAERGIIVCTIDYAESFDLETCATSWFLGYHLTVDQNEQAEGRTQRAINEHDFVTWRYITYLGTIDEYFLAKLGQDADHVAQVMKRSEWFIRKVIKRE